MNASRQKRSVKVMHDGQGELVTKSDIIHLQSDIGQLKAELKSDIQRLEDKISNLRWTMIVVAGMIVALIKLIP